MNYYDLDYTTAFRDGTGEVLIEEIRELSSALSALHERHETLTRNATEALNAIRDRITTIERRIDWSKPPIWTE